ncbi:ATP-dependent DNA helicase RecG [Fusobacterium necrophorum subsp. funduliforme ATCC 51357]|uniref:ATP-dependent DNA helicase RecG n=2 Tax=Fusobacterium necrophorum subsp. funduliforme TaxID=143387 RepID=A0A162J1V5_9FUSO|nr:ATP-dependent DNA helicase RecG [Fusobacterium necrophorum]AYV93827.1 ATP-dependent DNA helicase RecG [Fusobacterium necrophorum subsp. funduliforme]EIJ72437.1 ATP-dependent DNA helicase RecG [Fusobacterium necrophorum subsp. funduliforme ATCC 51357]EYD69022.1 ATP-dependent DNA helicase RecG [Fusobacterium necrophorum subsp. funduliforme B35]KAB0552914.1 ATP-dependent DNA helicase RecG [Fusobacterium necrophorum subsp. funduliforme]KYL04891.1 ATP-dependent DNA helicase RecG [Fusobacterium n
MEQYHSALYQGLDPKKYKGLKTLGIVTVHDLLYSFPRAYDNRSNLKTIAELHQEEYAVLHAKLLHVYTTPTRSGKRMTKATASDGSGLIEILWFGMPYLQKSLKLQEEYIFIGTVKRSMGTFQMTNPEFKLSKGQKMQGEILPIYSTHKNLSQNRFRKYMREVLSLTESSLAENIPEELCQKYKILERKQALWEIHFPSSEKTLEEAKRRFAIEELLIIEMGILKNRFLTDSLASPLYHLKGKKTLVKQYLDSLPFPLTRAQKKVITEIYKDLEQGRIVNRLVQGDVGSGKTIVAMILLLYMIENGYQGAFMAPTEILATQHYLGVSSKMKELGLRVELLTGSIRGKKRNELLTALGEGKIDLLIGTHALLEEEVSFHQLGFIVIDEQHRFGVLQRQKLREKGILTNLLVMTATPIPRSLALSIYGDLDVSILDELPPGRSPIKTKWIASEEEMEKMYSFIRKQLQQGRQAYFVAPLIEESDKLVLHSILEVEKKIREKLSDYNISILHGRMKSAEKEEIMRQFQQKEIDILVSTTVIEVGIDVPNAVIMTILNAERFGLSALHQLRGRVGRGNSASFCFLISKTQNESSKQRLKIMEATQDGFVIAEEDLKMRNAGEIFGLRQSGLSDLRFINLLHDVKTIKLVRDECMAYLRKYQGKILLPALKEDIFQKFKDSVQKD